MKITIGCGAAPCRTQTRYAALRYTAYSVRTGRCTDAQSTSGVHQDLELLKYRATNYQRGATSKQRAVYNGRKKKMPRACSLGFETHYYPGSSASSSVRHPRRRVVAQHRHVAGRVRFFTYLVRGRDLVPRRKGNTLLMQGSISTVEQRLVRGDRMLQMRANARTWMRFGHPPHSEHRGEVVSGVPAQEQHHAARFNTSMTPRERLLAR